MINPGAFKWLIRNVGSLALALVLAVSVWVSAVTNADPDEVRTYSRPVSLKVEGQDAGLIIVSEIPTNISVTLRAPRSVWNKLSTTDNAISAVIDLAGLSAGEHTLEVQIQQIRVAPARVISISPQSVGVSLQTLSTKTFPIRLVIRGDVPIGFEASPAEMDMTEINLSGPAPLIEQVKRIQADLSIAGQRQDIQTALPLHILDENGAEIKGLTLNPATVKVRIPIIQQGGYRDIAVKVVVRGQVADGYRLTNISVFPLILTVYSKEPRLVDELPGFVETEPLNLDDASEDIDTHPGLNLPAGISVVGDQTVQVRVGIAAIEDSRNLNNMKVEIIGLADGLEATISPETVDVILTGPLPLLGKLSLGDVKIVVDVAGLEPGVHQLVPRPEIIINDVHVQLINPTTIEVTISASGTPTVTPTPTPTPTPAAFHPHIYL